MIPDVIIDAGIAGGSRVASDPQSPSEPHRISPTVGLAIETRHVAMGRGWDRSFDAEIRREPVLAMVKTGDGAVSSALLGGFTAGAALRFAHASASSETAIVGRIAEARLDGGSRAAGNDIGAWAPSVDARLDWRWYGRSMSRVHLENQPLSPLVDAYGGVRHDQRFHRAGDLSGFDDPTGRLFGGFGVNVIRVADRRVAGGGHTLLTAGGGLEFETALDGTHRLPSGFRWVLRGDLDLAAALAELTYGAASARLCSAARWAARGRTPPRRGSRP